MSFSSSTVTDFITVREGSFNGPIVAFGATPLTFLNTYTGNLFVHWNSNAACGVEEACRNTSVQCIACCVPPTVPVVSSVSPPASCEGDPVTLSVEGDLNGAETWTWYTDSCNGPVIDTGATIVVNPTDTTTYYVRGTGGCITPGECGEITVNVNPTPDVDQPANQAVCNGDSTDAVIFTGSVPGTIYTSTNSDTSIGLAANGTGGIEKFLATNSSNAPVTATITVTPSTSGQKTFSYTGALQQYTVPAE